MTTSKSHSASTGRGRPSKLTQELIDRIATCFKVGMSVRSTCAEVGIDVSTFSRWMARGENGRDSIYRRLWEAVEKAHADGELTAAATLYKSSAHSWRAAAHVLKHRYPGWAKDSTTPSNESPDKSSQAGESNDALFRAGIDPYNRASIIAALKSGRTDIPALNYVREAFRRGEIKAYGFELP